MLKNKGQRAICNAFSKFDPCDAKAASRPVVVVPIFDPRVSGYILFKLITPIPTSGVKVEVKTELLWTRNVSAAPTIMAM